MPDAEMTEDTDGTERVVDREAIESAAGVCVISEATHPSGGSSPPRSLAAPRCSGTALRVSRGGGGSGRSLRHKSASRCSTPASGAGGAPSDGHAVEAKASRAERDHCSQCAYE